MHKRILYFPGERGIAVLAGCDIINVFDFCAGGIAASFDCERRESSLVLDAIQAHFGNSNDYFAILNDGGRGARMEHIEAEAENQQEGTCRS